MQTSSQAKGDYKLEYINHIAYLGYLRYLSITKFHKNSQNSKMLRRFEEYNSSDNNPITKESIMMYEKYLQSNLD